MNFICQFVFISKRYNVQQTENYRDYNIKEIEKKELNNNMFHKF
jgi:hypothetical protein